MAAARFRAVAGRGVRLAAVIAVVCACAGWTRTPPLTDIARQTSAVPGLLDVYRSALAENADYQAALAHYRATIEAKPQARSRLLPTLSASAGYSEVYQSVEGEVLDTTEIDRDDDFQRQNYGVTLSQPLYHRDAFIGLEQADIQLQRARLTLIEARNQLAMAASRAYFEFLDARNGLIFVRAEKRAIQRQLEQVRNQVNAGLISDAELKAAQAQYDLATADEISAENRIEISRTRLEGLTGRSYKAVRMLPPEAALPPLSPGSADPWIDAATQYNTKLRRQRATAQLAKLETDRARARRWPRLDLVGSYSYSDQNGGFYDSEGGIGGANDNEDARIGVRLTLPLFQGGLTSSRVREANASHEQQMALQTQQRIDTLGDTRAAFLNIRKDKARVTALDRAITSASAAAHAAQVGFNVGTSTSADVLSAVRDEYRARRDYALARSQYLLDLLELNRHAGQLDEKALAVIDRKLQ